MRGVAQIERVDTDRDTRVPQPKLLFVVNSADFFLSHRLCLAEHARARGWRVVVACGAGSGEENLARHRLDARVVQLSRSGLNPWREWQSYRALCALYRAERPDLVHHVTVKPVIYGTLAARATGIDAVVNAVPGLGHVFTARGALAALRRRIVRRLYRAAARSNAQFIFQNGEDRDAFVTLAGVARERTHLIEGSGVDLERFAPRPEPAAPITFLLLSRMLKDKGVREFVAAAERVRAVRPQWRFRMAGAVDVGNPSALDAATLARWQRAGTVDWLGHCDNAPALIASSHVVCLPSYREGLPKTLLEAAASGRAAIASDVPGCRDAVEDGVTGLLVPARDAAALAAAMYRLGDDAAFRCRLAEAARERAVARYGVAAIVRDTFRVYEAALAA
jgi:glycosyltransferase involved in cell wall biosynthesis